MMRLTVLAVLALVSTALMFGCADDEEAIPQGEPTSTSIGSSSSEPTDVTGPPSAPATTAAATSPGSTPEWQIYVDPALGFSFEYPVGLSFTDSGPPKSSAGWQERDLVFTPQDGSRPVFALAILDGLGDIELEAWAVEFGACAPETTHSGAVDGQQAVFCTSYPTSVPEAALIFRSGDSTFLVRSTLDEIDFNRLVGSIRL